MKVTHKTILSFVPLILLVSAANIYTTSHILVNLQKESLRASEFIIAPATELIITLIVTSVAVVIAVLLSKSITNPLLKLKKLAEMVSRGNMETRIDIKSKDEIGDLARSFNQMADDLKRKTVSKEYVDNIINSMIDTLIVTSREGIILRTNAAADRLLGYREGELIGQPIKTIIDESFPGDGPAIDDKFIKDFIGNREIRYSGKDGKKIPVMLSASIMRESSDKVQAIVCVAQDITRLKHAENILRQTKQDWEDTFNTITDMVTIHDKDYNIIRANKAAEKILGLPFLAKSTTKCFQYYHGTDAPPSGCPSCNCLKTKEPATFNVFEPHLNRFIEISSIPRIDGNKQLVGLIHVVRDITERKKDEERLKESEAKYRNLLETASDLIQSVDISGRFLYVNRKWLDVLGYTMDEVNKMTFMDVLSEDQKPHCAEIFGKLCAGEPVGQIETEFLTRHGKIIQVEGNINVQYKDGKFIATQGIFRDITARKQAEMELTERMHHAALLADVGAALTQSDDLPTVLQSCTDSIVINLHAAFARIWTLNENGNVLELQASSGMYTHLGGPHGRIPVGKLRIGRIALERKPHLTNNVFEDPEIGEPGWARQNGLTAFAGHPLVVADKLVGVIALFHYDPIKEITLNALSSVADEIAIGIERNNSKERLKEYSQKLKKSNEELEQFAYVASHDLQEPLRKVMTFGDRLKTKYTDTLGEHGRDYLERMQGAAMRMQTLINDLLTFSRVMTKAQPFAPVDLAEVARDVVSDLEVRIEQTCAHIEVDKLEVIDADPLQMRQLLQNLIGNSLKFIKKDSPPVIKVSGIFVNGNGKNGGSRSSDRDSYEITVEDNGIGFDEKYTDRIFGVFQRLHGRSEYEGTGIGLSICKKIVARHNGSITAQSAPGEGARFIVVLPVKQNEGMTNKE